MSEQEFQMPLPAQNLQALGHLYVDQPTNFGVLNLGGEPYENGSMLYHIKFGRETSTK